MSGYEAYGAPPASYYLPPGLPPGYAAHMQPGVATAPAPAAYGIPAPAPYGAPPGAAYGAPAAHPQYAPAYAQPVAAVAAPASDEVRTIFITGFPADVKERELNNMLRFMHGYEASQMTWRMGTAQGFAIFTTSSLARSACDAISQLIFDETSTLRCEMARKNMYVKDMEPSGKRARTGDRGGHSAGAPISAAAGYTGACGAGAAYRTGPYSTGGAPGGGGGGGAGGDNPPCNTLFVGNLAEMINEAELQSIFAPQQGFRQLKVVRGRNTTAFVEYDTIDNAAKVHASQQGIVLASNAEKGPLRIQFSRNPFGRKRDVAGAPVAAFFAQDSGGTTAAH